MTFISGLRLMGMTAPRVLDNPPAHKVTGIREAITARRAQIFLRRLCDRSQPAPLTPSSSG